ncbi:MAG TPA: hypothetical protein VHX39_37235 [Acetobacteraceae bacterium]|nr:hypothetical protein [Acetobacteraceae bacterium]
MDTTPAFSFATCCSAIAGDMAKALAERHGEPPEQKFARLQAAVHMIMGFLPRDVIEAMLASHCVMFHELMLDGVRDRFRARERKEIRAETQGVLALNKAFCGNLGHLKQYQTRSAEGSREGAGVTQAGAEPAPRPADMAVQEQAGQARTSQTPAGDSDGFGPASPAAHDPVMPARNEASDAQRPTTETTAAHRITPAAAAALEAGNAEAFARAMGIEKPSEAFLAAANAPGSPFDPGATATSGRSSPGTLTPDAAPE